MRNAADTIAKILKADKHSIYKMEDRLSAITGKKEVLEKIIEENNQQVNNRLLDLGVSRNASVKEVHDALISKIEADDNLIFNALGGMVCDSQNDCNKILKLAQKVAASNHGFFLKKEVARKFLFNEPPKKIMEFLGYESVEEMLKKESLLEIYSGLRFLEGNEWQNKVFFKQYEKLTPDDFEERPVAIHTLSPKWNEATKKFVLKKWHNISHLKELGVVFVIPISLGISGEVLRMLSLVFHYLHEIPFYSDLFKIIAKVPETFSENFVSLLRGDVLERHLADTEKFSFLVIQRYLAKDDENDWRLFYPHINPEATHWLRAEEDLVKMAGEIDGFSGELAFWRNLDWVGDYFKDEVGEDVLVSFNLVDSVMSLVREKELIKYLYHHQEALWNKIFMEYFSNEQLEKFSKEYLLQGYFEI
ncbi:MAG: hypothetical protein A3I89_01750 [Candidatus Harrisonbacteria bacterium RIFCSPLOWO2_02_FULL_41_11]|uniref:Glycosidase related protein n=1 Tax=Candidatus Harrisonbacteria bacterium RIFCSPHIGHO2_02_FULL_42_16 TaxID=1798404 RepID=A0A1G1ZFP0_9BACT|nr:MAG: hypothetical protein A3B92_02060 [Candidatus Harrisonbacteria bacterium RIFCSPHIGHO2_02_FULL_42_16]OGY65589.1 MAG: hypothetical protein A3I89_01750 [Candidatus Harrisonbacteria bacterium RIFCSPLOWO2_02_FULL_41_11]